MMRCGGVSGRVSASGGGPAAGTVVIGSVLTNDANTFASVVTNAATLNTAAQTATWAESASTTPISKIVMRCQGWDGGNVKCLLYSSANVLLATTNAVNFSYGDPASVDFTFASPPTITKGSSYKLALISSANYSVNVSHNNAGQEISSDTTGTYASPPATLTLSAISNTGILGLWAVV